MRATIMARDRNLPLTPEPTTGEPRQVAVTVIACILIALVFVIVAALI